MSASVAGPLRLSPRIGLVYAAGDIGPSLTSLCLAFYWLYFLIAVAHIPAATAGAIHASGYALSAAANLWAGHVLDRLVPAADRRARLIAIFGCLMALAFTFLWFVPAGGSVRIAWYLLASWLFHLFFSFVYLSYLSFTPLLGRSEAEHVALNSYRFGGTIVLALVVLGLYAAAEGLFPAGRRLAMLGGLVGFAAAAGALVCGLTLNRLFAGRSVATADGAMRWITLLGANDLRRSVGVNLAVWLMVQTTLVLTAFLCAGAHVAAGPILFLLQFSVISGAALSAFGARRWPSGLLLGGAVSCWCLGALSWRAAMPWPAALLLGLGLGTATVLSWADMARSIADLSAQTGQRSEARAFAGLTLLRDLISAIVPLIVGRVLSEDSDLAATSGLLTIAALATALVLAVLRARPRSWRPAR